MYDNIMDQYHRAAKNFLSELPETKESKKIKGLLSRNGQKSEHLSDVSFDIEIDNEWIERIEVALPHLEAAIREDRQFIKSEGNISPIERVRKVSRASVEHLARHSEMITHVPDEGEDLIPDKLKVYENESNYAVYENRVLYMVLCYTRDFTDHRFFRINEAWKERCSEMGFAKKVHLPGGDVSFELKLSDGSGGLSDPEEKTAGMIARIESITGTVAMLLGMPLMKEMALASMVTPPITRTNVLRMDTHFKEVVALYDYLSSYEGEGYTMERRENRLTPFPSEMEAEITELVMTSMYLNYKYGRNAAEELEKRYFAEEKRRAQERKERLLEMASDDSLSPEAMKQLLLSEIEEKDREIEDLKERLSEIDKLRSALDASDNREMDLRNRLQKSFEEREAVANRISAEKNQQQLRADQVSNAVEKLQEELELQTSKNRALRARVRAMLEEYGLKKQSADMTDREEFMELEREREAFDRFYTRNWKIAKKKIRKRILWGRK